MPDATFVAYASRLKAVTVLAALLPLVVLGALGMPLRPGAGVAERVLGGVILLPVVVWMAVTLRLLLLRAPVLEIDARGLLWRRWSAERIPWEAFDRWQARSTLGTRYATLWLKQPARHRATTVNRLLVPGNRWMSYGEITLAEGGTDAGWEELLAALRAHAPGERPAVRLPPDRPA
jgi:hypothetical protein